jgi:CBS domain-containing protein
MKAKHVMTHQVVSVTPDSSVAEVAEILLRNGVSAVPVIDHEKLVGIISEGDLLRRAEIGTAPARGRSWWLRLFNDNAALAAEYVKSHGRRVRDIMTKDVVTVDEETPLADIAAALEKNHIKRVPVMNDGVVVGIVSRANLIRQLAAAKARFVAPVTASDSAIRAQVLGALKAEPWSGPTPADLTVTDGVVEFWGLYTSEEERHAARILAENVPGVRQVEDHRMHIFNVPYGYV